MKNKLNILSNFLFYSGMIVGGFGLVKIYEIRSKLPEGVCPIDDKRNILVLAIILLVTSVIMEFIGQKIVKQD